MTNKQKELLLKGPVTACLGKAVKDEEGVRG